MALSLVDDEPYIDPSELPWHDPDCDEESRAKKVVETCRSIENDQAEIHQMNLDHARIYHNRELAAFSWGNGPQRASHTPISSNTENLSLTIVDALHNHVGKAKPKPTPTTRGADFVLRREAKKLDHWYYGLFKQLGIWKKGARVFKDALIYPLGCFYHDLDGNEICVERVHPDEIVVDQMECQGGAPPLSVFRRRIVQLETMAEMYPELRGRIANTSRRDWVSYRRPGVGWVVMVEAWHRGRWVNGRLKPGRYACVVDDVLVEDRRYTRDWLPFTFFYFQEPDCSFYGGNAIEQIVPYQVRLNETNMVIRESQDLMCRPRIAVEHQSDLVASKFDNRIGRVFKYRGKPPIPLVWPGAPQDLYAERVKIKQDCFEYFRMGSVMGQAKFSPGMRYDSSRAIREATLNEDQAWADLSERFQDAYLDVAVALTKLAGEIQKKGGNVKTTWIKAKRAGDVDFNAINLEDDSYVLTMEASNSLNETPAARMDRANELITRGIFSRAEIVSMLENPDLEHAYGLLSAQWECAEWIIAEIEEGESVWPDENMDLAYMFHRVKTQVVLWLQMKRVPNGVFVEARNFLIRTHGLMIRAGLIPAPGATAPPQGPPMMPDMAGAGMPPGAMPPGSPTPLPAANAISQVL